MIGLKIQSNFREKFVFDDNSASDHLNISEEDFTNVYQENQTALMQSLSDAQVFYQNVRVVLSTDGFQSLIHDRVQITAGTDYKVTYGNQTEYYAAGDIFEIDSYDSRFNNSIISIEPVSEDARLQLLSINRVCGHPKYRGIIELSIKDDGIVIVNQLPLEAYLYGVLPSEMPSSYGLEALKVQAVCARSFVYTSLNSGSKYAYYGADLDDSTSSQVYMNQGEDSLAIEAVDATKNQVLCFDGDIVRTYFFSTSCGVTSDVSDVWGGAAQDYLVPVFQTITAYENDMSNEAAFRRFIDLDDDNSYYEQNSSWFRWHTDIESRDIYEGIEKVNTGYKEGMINGRITQIQVMERGESGIAKVLKINAEDGELLIYGEHSIRTALSMTDNTINCHDGTKISNQSILPSGYFYVDKVLDGKFRITGGGFGHGVGMSQNGAAAMCAEGMDYKQVLQHFFSETEIRIVQEQ